MLRALSLLCVFLSATCLQAQTKPAPPASPSQLPDKPRSPADAARAMTLPAGFKSTLFAGEPDLVQPIAFTTDDRGRLWVVECLSYPKWTTDGSGKDRVVIFEDRDGDGRFDTRKVFFDKGANLSGIEVGFGGVWLTAIPNLLFIPDRNGDDTPDGAPEVLLDGWDMKARHNVVNALIWGPDGWLYGCNGILSNSRVGAPGTPDQDRTGINCGVWRYHPQSKKFEMVASGSTNPWGIDYDDWGQIFITNCVIKHLFHIIPGGHYSRMFGQDITPNTYGLIESCADHIHWAGGHWTESRGNKPEHDKSGGGHAHAGAMIYLGDNWPASYRNHLFTINIHGSRVNQDVLEQSGSGYVAHHGEDFLTANDPWFRGLNLAYGPDGGVYVSDWTDTGECHNYEVADQTNGRLFKVTYGDVKPVRVDLAKSSDQELVALQLHQNDWFVRHARRQLQERAAAGKLDASVKPALEKMLKENPDPTRKLRALWALHVTGGLTEDHRLRLLHHADPMVRSWVVRLELEDRKATDEALAKLTKMATEDDSLVVRLALASGLQRLPLSQRFEIAKGLIAHATDADDENIPLMLWYAIEPLVAADPAQALSLIRHAQISLVREYIARRYATWATEPGQPKDAMAALVALLGKTDEVLVQLDILRGVYAALNGRRHVPLPDGWSGAYVKLHESVNPEVRERAILLALIFDDPQALAQLKKTMLDTTAAAANRQHAVQALVQKGGADILPLLQQLVNDPAMRGAAIRGLAAYSDPGTPALLLSRYPTLSESEKADAINTLASRPSYATALLQAIEKGSVPQKDLPAFAVRQMLALKVPEISKRLGKIWGTARPTSTQKATELKKYKVLLASKDTNVSQPDLANGRLVFSRTCAVCHKLFESGNNIGPELTGAQRSNLDYVLENLIDPSALIGRDYQMAVIETKEGRIITGIVKLEDDNAVTIQNPTETVIVPRNEIEHLARQPVSMMPEGMLEKLSERELRDLVGYLASPSQVPLPGATQSGAAR